MSNNGVRVQGKGQVTIPLSIRKKLNLKQGDLVIFQETPAGIVLTPAAVVAREDLHQQAAALVRTVREKFQDYSAEEVEALVQQALREAREQNA